MSGYWVQGQADGWRSRVASTLGIGQLDAACAAMVHLAQHAHNPSKATYGNRLGAVQLRGYTDLARKDEERERKGVNSGR